jgi:hypothetical protein
MTTVRNTICLNISTQRMDFWLQMAARLSETADVILLAAPAFRPIAERRIPGKFKDFVTKDLYMAADPPGDPDAVLAEALAIERRYGVTMSLMISNLRDLGKGYIFNADCHPDMISSWWSHEHKLLEMVRRFRFWEEICDRFNPVLIIGESNSPPAGAVARVRGIREIGLGFIKYGDRHFWTENSYYQNTRYFDKVRTYVDYFLRNGSEEEEIEYPVFESARYLDAKIDNGYRRAVRDGLTRIYRETRHRVKRGVYAAIGRPLAKKPGYRYLGWLSSELRRPFSFGYMQKLGKRPEDLVKYKTVYLPMHLEPEIALMSVSPEFNNTMEMVSLLSKALPADYMIVLKENVVALGIRSLKYYDQLRRIGNVAFADMSVPSWDWIKSSEFTVTMTGTAAIEAVYFLRPVLSFGKHQVVNLLPSVRYANNFDSTSRAIAELGGVAKDLRVLRAARAALNRAQFESSFDLPGSAVLYDGGNANLDLVVQALESLKDDYPEVFAENASGARVNDE